MIQVYSLQYMARERGTRIVSNTDSFASTLLEKGGTGIAVPSEGASLLHSMTPAFATTEIIAALVARRNEAASLEALGKLDALFAALGTFLT